MLLHDGQIVQAGTPGDVFAHPVSGWVADFLGLGIVIEGMCLGRGRVGDEIREVGGKLQNGGRQGAGRSVVDQAGAGETRP